MFLDPQNEIGPSTSSSVVLFSSVLLVYIVTLVLIFYLCPSSVRVVATFPGTNLVGFNLLLGHNNMADARTCGWEQHVALLILAHSNNAM